MSVASPRVAVVGGGISGLSAAHRLTELAPHARIVLFEAAGRVGGVLGTEQRADCMVERSADMFITRDPWAMELCKRIGFGDRLVNTNPAFRQSFVVCRGKLEPIPEGFTLMSPARIWPILTTKILSWPGKMRLASEFFIGRRDSTDDESLADFSIRRFGREAYQRLIQPLIGGIYTADPNKLSMQATMKQFVDLEQKYGSLIRGMRAAAKARPSHEAQAERAASGARYGLFVAPKDGMSSFIEAVASRLPDEAIRLNSPVSQVRREADGRWFVTVSEVDGSQSEHPFDAVIVAAPAYRAAEQLNQVEPELAKLLGGIPHAGAAVVVSIYRRAEIRHPLDGFGFVVPLVEKRRILSGSFSSVKFTHRAPEDRVVFRSFLGGACQPELLELTDHQLLDAAHEELSDLLGISGRPMHNEVVRWHGTMPQYHVGHLQKVDEIERRAAALPGFALAGNAYRGVGIPFCVRSGEAAAQRIVDGFSKS